jgi:putative RNA 2'-phosphotransferase
MGHMQQLTRLAKLLGYVLGRRPDEFGLIPDAEGFVKIKNLLQALSEEAGWRHVRQAHLRELTLSLPKCPVEIVQQRIRAVDRSRLRVPSPDTKPPKLLYTYVRQKAYAHVLDRGIPARGAPLILCGQETMAARIGRRRDRNAIQLTVNTAEALARGVVLAPCGEALFAADRLPPGCFSGPAPPKRRPVKEKAEPEPPAAPPTPGSFLLDPAPAPSEKGDRKARRKDQAWKRERRRRNRRSNDKWP